MSCLAGLSNVTVAEPSKRRRCNRRGANMVPATGREREWDERRGKEEDKEGRGYIDTRREITEEEEGKRTLRQVVRIITSNGKRRLWVTIVAFTDSSHLVAALRELAYFESYAVELERLSSLVDFMQSNILLRNAI